MKITIQTPEVHAYSGAYPEDLVLSVAAVISEELGIQGATVTVDMENGTEPQQTTS